MKLKLKAVGLFVKAMHTLVTFWRDVVGMDIKWDGQDPSVITPVGNVRFMRFGRKDFEPMSSTSFTYPESRSGSSQLALCAGSEADVHVEYERMVGLGATPITQPKKCLWGLEKCLYYWYPGQCHRDRHVV